MVARSSKNLTAKEKAVGGLKWEGLGGLGKGLGGILEAGYAELNIRTAWEVWFCEGLGRAWGQLGGWNKPRKRLWEAGNKVWEDLGGLGKGLASHSLFLGLFPPTTFSC